MKIKDNKKIIIILTSIILGFFVLNGPKFLSAAFSYMMHYFDNVIFKEEVKKITFDSEHYTNGTPGDYTVDKSADWTGRNEATIEFKISTNLMSDNEDKDVIFVLDTSGSMIGEKYERLSKDAIELISRLLTNPKNTVSLISFDSDVQILAEYSKDKDTLINQINSFEIYGATDYYLALKAVDEVLDSYVVQENRDCIVVFLTDGFPTQSNSNQLPQFEILNSKYPFTKLVGKDVNTLIFPCLSAASSSYKMLQALSPDTEIIGPIQMGLNKPIHFIDFESSVQEIMNVVAVAAIDAIVDKKK
jgi:hypothetical protein